MVLPARASPTAAVVAAVTAAAAFLSSSLLSDNTSLNTLPFYVEAFTSRSHHRLPISRLGTTTNSAQIFQRCHRQQHQRSCRRSSLSSSLTMHGPSLGGHDHSHSHSHHHIPSTSSTTSTKSYPSVQKRNALIRIGIVAFVTLAVGKFKTGRILSKLNVGLAVVLSLFLATVERGRGVLAEARTNASALWSSFEAHTFVNPDDTQGINGGGGGSGVNGLSDQAFEMEVKKARAAERVTVAGTVVNVLLSIFKLFAGIVGKSSAMIADAGHSLSDLASDLVTLWSVRIGRLPADDDHPYGHGRFEALGALVIAGMLCLTGVGFGTYAYEKFLLLAKSGGLGFGEMASATTTAAVSAAAAGHHHHHGHGHVHVAPTGKIALLAAFVSIISKELLYRATARVAEQTESQVLLANAWHHRSDAFSSIVALVSIWGATSGGIPALDPLGGLFVAGMVGVTGLRVGWSALKQLTDTQDFELKAAVERAVNDAVKEKSLQDDVLNLQTVRARYVGSRAWVDMEVETNPQRSASAASQVAKVLRDAVLAKVPSVSDVVVVLKTHPEGITAANNDGNDIGVPTSTTATETATTADPNVVGGDNEPVVPSSGDDTTPIDAVHGHGETEHAAAATTTVPGAYAASLSPRSVEASVREALAKSKAFGYTTSTATTAANTDSVSGGGTLASMIPPPPSSTTTSSFFNTRKKLKEVTNVLVHFSSSPDSNVDGTVEYCDVDLIVSIDESARLTVSEARELAEIARRDVIENAVGVRDAKVSLELVTRKADEEMKNEENDDFGATAAGAAGDDDDSQPGAVSLTGSTPVNNNNITVQL